MLHTALIAAHAASGIIALALGVVERRPRATDVSATFRSYLGALWLMVLLLVLVVALDWVALDLVSRLTFGALTLLALYTGWRGWHAFQQLHRRTAHWQSQYVEDVGFTLIALFDGFVIIGALDLGAPVWLVVGIGVLGVLVGRLGVGRTRQRVAA